MATKITRISAKDDGPKTREDKPEEISRKVSVKAKDSGSKKTKAASKAKAKEIKKADKLESKKEKKVGYFRGSFQELRQVRWPNRKETWKMTLSVIVYVVVLAVVIMLLDALLQLLFTNILKGN
jgi:preprotein translocase SecE subunit